VAQVLSACLPGKREALISNPRPPKTKTNKQKLGSMFGLIDRSSDAEVLDIFHLLRSCPVKGVLGEA
jgi:hypothetical protein